MPVFLPAKFTYHARRNDLLGVGSRLAPNLNLLLRFQLALQDNYGAATIDQQRASGLLKFLAVAIGAGRFQQHGQRDTISPSHRRRSHQSLLKAWIPKVKIAYRNDSLPSAKQPRPQSLTFGSLGYDGRLGALIAPVLMNR